MRASSSSVLAVGMAVVIMAAAVAGQAGHYDMAASRTPTTKFLSDYTRVWVPTGEQVDFGGGARAGDLVVVTFERNAGRAFQHPAGEPNHWVPLVCLYTFVSRTAPAAFGGCFNGLSATMPRADAADARVPAGGEVFVASSIAVQTLRGASAAPRYDVLATERDGCDDADYPGAADGILSALLPPRARITIPKRAQTFAEKQLALYDMVRVNSLMMDRGPSSPYTPQAQAALIYFQSFVNRQYLLMRDQLAAGVTFEVVGLTNYSGRDTVYYYQLLADFHTSDLLNVDALNLFHPVQTGHYLEVQVMMESSYPHLQAVGSPLSQWNNKYPAIIEFDRYGQIAHFVMHPNLLDAYIRRQAQGPVNSTHICETIGRVCTASVVSEHPLPGRAGAVQYDDLADCLAYLASIPQTGPTVATQTSGLNLPCVDWHTQLAISFPAHHCSHVGKARIDRIATPCQNF